MEADHIINAFLESVLIALKEDNEISLSGFGRFYKTQSKARMWHNSRTGETMIILAYVQSRFTTGIKLKKS